MQTYRLKLLAIIFCLAIVVGMTPTIVFAQGIDYLPYNSMTSIDNESDDGEDEIIAGELPPQEYKIDRKDSIVIGTRLSGLNKIVYDSLKSKITQVAEGKKTSTQLIVSLSEMGLEGKKWTAADIGVSKIVKDDEVTDEAYAALIKKIGLDLGAIHNALVSDCTYELYWYDIEKGLLPSGLEVRATKEDSVYKIYFYTALNAKFTVSKDYSNGAYTVDSKKIARVNKSIQNAKSIVDSAKNKGDYEKLLYYRDTICNSVSFDFAADDPSTPYGDPWQLISVFDDDSNTNVVDAGYAKAFKYLCDLSEFDSDISCVMVDGYVGVGEPGDTYHIWNIVKMGDGKNYLVDLIFCDVDDLEDRDCMFLVGCSSGSVNSNYVIKYKTATTYLTYHDDAKKTFTTDELTLSNSKFVPCGGGLYWSLKDYTLTIYGKGEMYNWTSNDRAPWDSQSSLITRIEINPGVTKIGDYAFYCCYASKVSIPNTVTSIGKNAFGGCVFSQINIPDSVETIGEHAFSFCKNLTNFTIPNRITTLSSGVFSHSERLTEITVPDSVTRLDPYVFSECKNLKKVILSENITTISQGVFYGCINLTSIVIPNKITSIEYQAFCGCTNLANIVIPDKVTYIGIGAFDGCEKLTSIKIPESVKTLCANAFSNCTGLSSVVISKSLFSSYGTGAFPDTPSDVFHFYYSLTYTDDGHGTVIGKAKTYGTDVVDLTISPDSDYTLNKLTWSDGTKALELKPDKNGKYIMSDSENDVVISASFKKLWSITISETENGIVTVKNTTAYTGDEINLNVTPNTGYEIDTIIVNDKEITETKFTMPDSDVTVSVTFKKSVYTVSFNQIGDGSVELSKSSACYKDEITVTATPGSGNKLAYIKVNDEIIQGNVFEMPAKNTSIEVAFAKDHKLTAVAAVKPTCTEDGNVAYYECKDPDCKCDLKYSDKYGLNEIDNIIDPATGHRPEKVDAKAATCTEKGHNEHWKCTKCGCLFSDSEGKNAIEAKDTVTEALGHDLEHVDAKAETYQKDGHIEHYFCKRENCGKKFADPDAKTELKDEDIIIPRKGAAVLDEEATVGNFIYKVTNPATDGTGTVTLIGVETRTTSVSIPGAVEIKESFYNVNRIGPKAFYGNKTIKTLSIGPKVVIIDANAFYGCSNLTKVSGGKALKTIGISAFARCTKLKSFSISSPVLSKIGSYAFNKDKKLKTLNIKYTTKLTKSGVKKSLKGSKIKTVKVKKSKVKAYKKIFKKKNSGRTVRVKK